ncbi:MAG: hypothetical protein EVJ46_08065 [Candidatus Acididesulfobacter guangdongensis]|uniref:TrbI/VirB10 family protein n=1 Tax=Acididesulfobacter guangdongensis TaxID=2597225 RepID=A0A519BFT9_ACIG2|nr:MAG: hypothetical protein EVJ46_08065 [Candidatus Acididesulfobacter guangdongensis]
MDDELDNPHIISEEQLNYEEQLNRTNKECGDNCNDSCNDGNYGDNYNSNCDEHNYDDNDNNDINAARSISSASDRVSAAEDEDTAADNNKHISLNAAQESSTAEDMTAGSNIYNSTPDLKNKRGKFTFLKSFNGLIIISGIIIALFIMFKFLYFNGSEQKHNNKTEKAIGYKNKIINYKKRFSPRIFNYGSSNKTDKPAEHNGKLSKKFYREMEMLKKLKNNEHRRNKNRTVKKNLLPINKKIVVFIKQSYEKLILNSERGLKNNTRFKNNIMTGGFNLYQKKGEKGINYKNVLNNSIKAAIPIGTVVNAYIKYKIFSYNTEVPVIAILSNTYYYKNKQFLKKGDKFFGMVSIKHSINRLNIHFNRIIKTDGSSLNINAIAMMPNGSGGVKGNVHRHYAANALTSLAQGVVGAAAMFAGGGSAVNSSNPYTFQNQIRQNVAQNELNQAQNGLDSMASSAQQTTITLPEGTPIKIIFLRAVHINQLIN